MDSKQLKKAAACGIFFSLAALPVSADVMLKQRHHTDGFTVMGKAQPAKDFTGTLWISAEKARNNTGDQSVILLTAKNVVIILDHVKKTAMEISLDAAGATGRADGSVPEGMPAGMQEMMQGMMKSMKFKVTETGETRTINGWLCRKYLQTVEGGMAPSESEVWASTDVKIDAKAFQKVSEAMMATQPGLANAMADIRKETAKIKGIAVLTVTTSTVMNQKMKSSVELLEVNNNATAPAGTYQVPAGYRKTAGF
jgi:hypothetical protein